MRNKVLPIVISLFMVVFIGSTITDNNVVQAQESEYITIDDTISYSILSTGAFIPYGGQYLHLSIEDLADPNNRLIDLKYGGIDFNHRDAILLNESISADLFILNNESLQSNWLQCPVQNISESLIVEFWNVSNLNNISEVYDDVERESIELAFNYSSVFHGDDYNIAVRWLWDYKTGVLLNNSITFVNTADSSQSGEYELELLETTVWEPISKVIPGFPLIWIIIFALLGMSTIIFILRKKRLKFSSNRFSKSIKFMFIATIILTSSFLFISSSIPSASASPGRIMPRADVLLLTNNTESVIATSLGLDDSIDTTMYLEGVNSTDDLQILNYSQYDVIIADGYLPNNNTILNTIKSNINGTNSDVGLIFFGGNYSENALVSFAPLLPVEFVIDRGVLNTTIIGFFLEQSGIPNFASREFYHQLYLQTDTYEIRKNDVQVTVSDEQEALEPESQSMYVSRIAWQSTPLLYERILTYAKKSQATTLIEVPTTKEPLIVIWEQDWDVDDIYSKVIYISPGVATVWDYESGEDDEWNTPFHLWPYFNYMLYLMVYDVKGLDPEHIESYADWPWSPIPHRREAIVWMVFVGSLWVFNFTLFFVLRRKSKNRDLAKSDNSPNFEKESKEDTKENPSKET